jgi:hypothetical protein
VCDSTVGFLGLTDVDCHCEGDAADGVADASASCVSGERCLLESTTTGQQHFCGSAAIFATVQAGSEGLSAFVNSCLMINARILKESELDDYELCVDVATEGTFKFNTCEASMNGEPCWCEICEDGVVPAFILDCSMINLSPFADTPIYGPKIDVCSLVDFSNAE